jgi:hypothetical protein
MKTKIKNIFKGMNQEHTNKNAMNNNEELNDNPAHDNVDGENTSVNNEENTAETANESVRDFEAELLEKDDK